MQSKTGLLRIIGYLHYHRRYDDGAAVDVWDCGGQDH